jgi:23S rRNA (uridine2552-2'-O)-methyltransferase
MMANKSSNRWLQEHFRDPYVKRAKEEGYRSRAVYKLLELQERDRLFKPGMVVVDLGAAPGGWSQVISKCVKPKGKVIALDILPMDEVEGVEFIQADFTEDAAIEKMNAALKGESVDWVVSDMAPNMSGNETVDLPKSMYLAELALDFATKVLTQRGGFLIKMFQGQGFDPFYANMKQMFKSVTIRKPKASRGRSREVYIVAKEFKAE